MSGSSHVGPEMSRIGRCRGGRGSARRRPPSPARPPSSPAATRAARAGAPVIGMRPGRMQPLHRRAAYDVDSRSLSSRRPASAPKPPVARALRRARPVGLRVLHRWERRGVVELRDLPVQPEGVRLGREAARGERVLERAVLGEDLRGRLGADAARAGKLVRGIAAQGDEIRHLFGLDAVALAHLRRADAGDLAHAACGLEDGHGRGGQLERVAVGGRDERLPATGRLGVGGGRQKVVGLVSGPFGDGEAEGRHQLGQERQLLEQLRVEFATRLVRRRRTRAGRSAPRACPRPREPCAAARPPTGG